VTRDRTVAWFDCDGTLVEFTRPYDAVLETAFERGHGESAPAWVETYEERFFEAFGAFEPDPYERAMAAVCETHSLDADPGALAEERIAAEIEAVRPRPGVLALLDAVEAAGHGLGVLTNGVARVQRGKLDRHDLAGRFDATVVSHDVGAHKPDTRIFEAAREAVPADEHVFVGDSYEHDVVGAREAGFRAIHLRNDENDCEGSAGPVSTTPGALAALVDPE